VHTQIRVAHRLSDCSLEVVQERTIRLMLTGWHDPNRSVNRDWQELLRLSPCDLLMIRPIAHRSTDIIPPLNRWFIPTAGGPNSTCALDLLPALIGISQQPEVALCQIRSPHTDYGSFSLERSVRLLEQRLPCPVVPQCLDAPNVPQAIAQAAMEQRAQVILLGASRESFLQQAWQGSIPEAVARQCPCTVVVFRRAEPPQS
jgi:CIC family chloride channel protein